MTGIFRLVEEVRCGECGSVPIIEHVGPRNGGVFKVICCALRCGQYDKPFIYKPKNIELPPFEEPLKL